MREILKTIVREKTFHGKWLNTLSYLENCGARLIAACEHPTLVKEEMLKHAAEEFRHAHHLKKQIRKVSTESYPDYRLEFLMGGVAALNYLKALNVRTCRYLQKVEGPKELSYLLVTYAIELRAEALYPLYDEVLHKEGSRVGIRAILLEEKEHLNEMRAGLNSIPLGFVYAAEICRFEQELYEHWVSSVETELS